MSWYFIPNGIVLFDSTANTFTGVDFELRYGLEDGQSDVGLRIPSASGVIGTYKRRLNRPDSDGYGPAVGFIAGLGVVNFAQHGIGEFTILASTSERSSTVAYGGLRVMQVVPIAESAVTDSPTAGGFLGARFGRRGMGLSFEVGVYYDESALGIRTSNVIIVPSMTIHGEELIRMFTRGLHR